MDAPRPPGYEREVESKFWKERWEQRQIGFHLPEPHRYLKQFGDKLLQGEGTRILVPLCGKSPDMLWFVQNGAQVVGAELVQTAADEFFQETGVEPERRSQEDHLRVFDSRLGIEIYVGDFFALSEGEIGQVTSIYDRAALVALPPEMRVRYAARLLAHMGPSSRLLLVTMVYEQEQMNGPPFSVSDDEVRSLFGGCRSIEQLHSESIIETEPRFVARGLSSLFENCYLIER